MAVIIAMAVRFTPFDMHNMFEKIEILVQIYSC